MVACAICGTSSDANLAEASAPASPGVNLAEASAPASPDAGRAGVGAPSSVEVPDEGQNEVLPLGWSRSIENGVLTVVCAGCVREHLRSIEAKLATQWW